MSLIFVVLPRDEFVAAAGEGATIQAGKRSLTLEFYNAQVAVTILNIVLGIICLILSAFTKANIIFMVCFFLNCQVFLKFFEIFLDIINLANPDSFRYS